MNFLLDENMSPRLVERLADRGLFAQWVVHLGRAGIGDRQLWRYALDRDLVVITINGADFLRLARGSVAHPGLIILRNAELTPPRQWAALEPAIDLCLREAAAGRSMVNRVVEIGRDGAISIYPLPAEDPVRR